jgi:hypothetical protein
VDDTVRPARLGAEIGRSENRHIRHRFFSIVDRSGLELNRKVTQDAVAAGNDRIVTLSDPPGMQQPWVIQPGMLLEVIPPNASELGETVMVKAVNLAGNTLPGRGVIAADFQYPHSASSLYVLRGHGGPKDRRSIVAATAPAGITAGVNSAVALNNLTLTIPVGTLLQVDTGANRERVVVRTSGPGIFTADFTISHLAPLPITISAVPESYNPKHDTNVVLHMSVIK